MLIILVPELGWVWTVNLSLRGRKSVPNFSSLSLLNS